jgi:3-oxoacyl-[acyl-carrier protein] reductase
MGKRVLVTGGNKGIGIFITKAFLEHGYEVIVAARDFSGFSLAGDDRVKTVTFDLSNPERVTELVEIAGEINVLVNNSGISTGAEAESYAAKDRDYVLNLNLISPVALINGFLPLFKAKGGGRVVNIASQAGVFGHYDVWYGASKAALINITKSYASLYGPQGLVINSVSPGPVDVDVIRGTAKPERFEKIRNRTILKRYAFPEEVASVVYWLAAESPEYLNGENYMINNGVTSLDT